VSLNGKPQGEVAKRFFGAWRYVGSSLDGQPVPGRGDNPRGIICYDPSGHMSVQVAPDLPRAKVGKEATPDEAKTALSGYVAYFGTYSIDEAARTVTHHRQASVQPGDVGDLVRGYEFTGDRLILRPPGTTHEVIWERIK
jgi:Lipocalin-like domain